MTRLRRLSPWYWVMVAALALALILLIANFVFDWQLTWLSTLLLLLTFASNIYVFRHLWKETDHPAFHRPQPDRNTKPTAK